MYGDSYECVYCVQHDPLEVRHKCWIRGVQQRNYIITLNTKYVL